MAHTKKKTIIITIIAIITGIHNPGATPQLAFACTTKRHALIQSIMNNERKTCVQCCTLCVPLAQFCYNCGSRLTADPPSSCDSSSSESSGEEAPVHQDAVAADATPAPCHGKKRKRRSAKQTREKVHGWRTHWDNPHKLGDSVVALRIRGLLPDVALETMEELMAGVSAKARIKVDAGKVGAQGKLRSKCAEITFYCVEAADEARHVLEAHPSIFVNPKELAIRTVRL